MVPKGWKKTYLKCVISGAIKNGYSPLPASATTGYWVLSLGALTDHGINPLEIKPVVVDEKVKQALLSDGDFLVSRSNTPDKVGRSIRFKNEVQNCSYPDLMMRFCIDATKADPDFIEIKLKSTEVRQYYKSCAAGSSSSMVKINKAVVENTPLLLPSFPEQKKIAKILSTWDKAISNTEQLLANSQQQKNALMQQLLTGKKRLLDNNGIKSRVSKTPYATLPSDWGEISMEEVSSFITKGATPTTYGFDWQDTGIPFLRSECVGEDGFKESGLAFICDEAHEAMKRSKVFTGDLLITITGNVGRVCKLPEHICEANINQHIAKITLNPQQVNTDFIYHCLRDIKYRNYFERITTGQAYPQISLVQVRDVLIPLPSREEQQKIANVLSTADQQITTLQQKLAALKQEKRALMQQLLTGKRRVKVEEAA